MTTINSIYKKLLYESSPLLPIITKENIAEITDLIDAQKIKPLIAMSKGLLKAKEKLENQILREASHYFQPLGINLDDFYDFLLGFSITPYVILNCYQQSLSDLNLGSGSELVNRVEYINKAAAQFSNKISSLAPKEIPKTTTKIFTFCEENPYINNQFYKTGVVASLITMREFFLELKLGR